MIDIEKFYLGFNNYTLDKNFRLKNIFSTIFQISVVPDKKKVYFSEKNIVYLIDYYNTTNLFYTGYDYMKFRSEFYNEVQLKMLTDNVNHKEAIKLLYQ